MNSDDILWERLALYVSGEASATVRAEIERWAADDPANRAMLDSLQERWEAARAPDTWDVNAAWARLSPRLATATDLADESPADANPARDRARVISIAQRRPRRFSSILLPLAAVLVLAVGVTTIWRSRTTTPETVGTLAATDAITTGVGERRTIDLPDGSQVVLGAASTVRFDADRSVRRVYLEGQALFRVTHDSARPFLVHAGGTVTEDLGTEFDIRAYPGEAEVRVAVIEGAVAVRRQGAANDTSALLRPRDVARIDATGAAVVLHDQNVGRLLAWTRGELFFDDATVVEVCEELERWYDIECQVTNSSIAGRRYSGDLRVEALENVLQAIDLALPDVVIERQGRSVSFRPGSGVGRGGTFVPPRPPRTEVGA
ncbi:MAG TPA: FecR domain-containing protein [Gemmatimonadaceae bacterium]